MAETESGGIGGEVRGSSGTTESAPRKRLTIKYAEPGEFERAKPTSGSEGRSERANRRKSAAEARRTQVEIEDNVRREEVKGDREGSSTLPKEKITTKAGRPRLPTFTKEESVNTSKFLISCVEMVGMMAAGPSGEMTPLERGMIEPPLQRILERTPVAAVERAVPIIDVAFLMVGGVAYFMRVSKKISLPVKQEKPKAVQEDIRAPTTEAPKVDNPKPGDLDGIAVPVPDIITQHMNGAI